jgi:hypothetical protein
LEQNQGKGNLPKNKPANGGDYESRAIQNPNQTQNQSPTPTNYQNLATRTEPCQHLKSSSKLNTLQQITHPKRVAARKSSIQRRSEFQSESTSMVTQVHHYFQPIKMEGVRHKVGPLVQRDHRLDRFSNSKEPKPRQKNMHVIFHSLNAQNPTHTNNNS